ncbi:MAG TPA: hypothetical protein VIX37_24205 [Candidatus Sulfotelmatobacter sp.]
MRSRLVPLTLSLYLTLAVLGCTSKPSADTSTDTANPVDTTTAKGGKEMKEGKEAKEARKEKKKEPVIVPAGTSVTVNLGSALGSKLSQAGQTFTGTVAKDTRLGTRL